MRVEGIAALCDLLGYSHQTVAEWQEQGMPVLERGGPNRPSVFDSAAVLAWLVQRAVARVHGETPRDRLFRVQADTAEHALAAMRARLIDVDQVEPMMRAAVAAAREGLALERQRLVAQLDGVSDRRQREELIAAAHETFLRRLAKWRPAGAPAPGIAAGGEASA